MIFIEVADTFVHVIDVQPLERAAQMTLQHLNIPSDSGLTIVLTDDTQIRQLNNQYLGIDAPTDVLAFPADYIDPESKIRYLGDIVISFPRAKAQAIADQHPIEEELQLLVVHGTLHLLGFDHEERESAHRMWQVQGEILLSLGCSIENSPL